MYLVLTLVFSGRGSRPSVMTTGGLRGISPPKSIPGPTVAATIGVLTDLVTLSLTTADKFVRKRAAFI